MAENIEMIRPINLPEAQQLSENDVFILDSETGGVRKIPKNKVYTPVDDTLSESGEAADAKVTGEKIDELKAETALIQNPIGNKSGELVSFSDGADMPAKSVIVNIVPKQSGTGTPSPDNVRPISGWESVNVYKSGKNVLEVRKPTTTINGVTFTVDSDGTVTVNGTATASTYFPFLGSAADKLDIPDGTYYLSGCPSGGSTSTYYIAANNGSWKVDYGNGVAITSTNRNINSCEIAVKSGVTVNNIVFKPQLELGSTATTYEPYTGTTTPVNLGRTVYGGTLDVVSGVLTVTGAYLKLNTANLGGSDSWPTWVGCGVRELVGGGLNSIIRGALSSIAGTVYANTSNTNDLLFISASEVGKTKAELIAMAIDVDFYIPLATPQTYQLTPTEIQTLLGDNNVWADSGDVEITYRRDINIVIDELTNAIVSLGSNV